MKSPNPPFEKETQVWLVSACLLGFSCRYDGKTAKTTLQTRLSVLEDAEFVPFCPEAAGGLGTPRAPASIHGGDGKAVLDGIAQVITCHGKDVTKAFRTGAEHGLNAALVHGATHACLKARSPSCGVGQIHTDKGLRPGDGVAAALLRKQGLTILSDEDLVRDNPMTPVVTDHGK